MTGGDHSVSFLWLYQDPRGAQRWLCLVEGGGLPGLGVSAPPCSVVTSGPESPGGYHCFPH